MVIFANRPFRTVSLLLFVFTPLFAFAEEPDAPVITLERTACFGTCPVYSLEIYADGTVIYEGKTFVGVTGRRRSHIPPSQVQQLVHAFLEIDYFSLKDSYRASLPDGPTTITTLQLNGRIKRIENYGSAPEELTELEYEIDRAVNTHQWLHPADDLKDGFDTMDLHTKPGMTELMQIAARWHVFRGGCFVRAHKVLKQEIEVGGDINAQDETGWTALMLASASSAHDNVRLLLESGARVNHADSNGDTTLIVAASARWFDGAMSKAQTKVLQLLLNHGADVNATNNRGQTALMWAAQSASSRAVEILLRAGADPQIRDESNKTALHYARETYDRYKEHYYAHRFRRVVSILEKKSSPTG
ncbi:ankyrin repeat domain-containing protein [Acidobacteriia bacterium AH_259_A11_L15]|nr:ankyrin repeat domain-containing protein [Acidobacteriia bacterium AH_259_A11_L15]